MTIVVRAKAQCAVASVDVATGETVAKGTTLATTELMKMVSEHIAPMSGRVLQVHVAAGDLVAEGDPLVTLDQLNDADTRGGQRIATETDHPALAELQLRRAAISDEGRSDRVARRHATGGRTARENILDLLDENSFSEIGAHVFAAQRSRLSEEELIERSAGDGIIVGTGTVNGKPVAVIAADYTVMAATQGWFHHHKVDRILQIARRRKLPLVIWPEGGGGRPNDVDTQNLAIAWLSVTSFRELARLANAVPVIAVVHGYCFAGSAAFAAVADIVIMTEGASLGMGGPAMIEGGGLGAFAPEAVGPSLVMAENGVAQIIVKNEAEGTAKAKELVSLFSGENSDGTAPDTKNLRKLMPPDRKTVFDIRRVVRTIADRGSFLELEAKHGQNIVSGFARVQGHPICVLANDSAHLGGAIDGIAASKAERLFNLAQKHNLAIVSLIDTPGFMVGPEAEATGQAREIGGMFRAGAALTVPLIAVVLRRAYGLGAMAMAGGGLQAADLTIAWPSGEVGAMGLEGAVRLGARAHLETIKDETKREAEVKRMVGELEQRGRALNAAAHFEFDDVIDPAETRERIVQALTAAQPPNSN